MPEDRKLSQIGSSPLPPPFRGLHSPGVRKHCQIIFACYFRKSSIDSRVYLLTNSIQSLFVDEVVAVVVHYVTSHSGRVHACLRVAILGKWPEIQRFAKTQVMKTPVYHNLWLNIGSKNPWSTLIHRGQNMVRYYIQHWNTNTHNKWFLYSSKTPTYREDSHTTMKQQPVVSITETSMKNNVKCWWFMHCTRMHDDLHWGWLIQRFTGTYNVDDFQKQTIGYSVNESYSSKQQHTVLRAQTATNIDVQHWWVIQGQTATYSADSSYITHTRTNSNVQCR